MISALQRALESGVSGSVVGQALAMGKHRERATRDSWPDPVVGVGRQVGLKGVRCL